ncbi:MAG: HNH endonuclease [Chloroflexota bacterium]|nr:HNH endonuclease [Chloroflexota bacterium]
MPNTDPEKRRACQREYIKRTWQRHLEHSKEAMRRWRANNPVARLARDRAYKERHKDQVNAGYKRYRQKHPDIRLAISRRRRAREMGAAGNVTLAEWLELLERHERRCAYCGVEAPLEADHRVPLSRGGTHDIENILPACGPCNRRKAAMSEVEFRRRLANEGKRRRKIDDEAG